jgi:hypothetical protein
MVALLSIAPAVTKAMMMNTMIINSQKEPPAALAEGIMTLM